MRRILGVLLLAVSLLPRISAESGLSRVVRWDDRAAVAVSGNVGHFTLDAGGPKRLLDTGSVRPTGLPLTADGFPRAPWWDPPQPVVVASSRPRVCPPVAERLTYHANAPPA